MAEDDKKLERELEQAARDAATRKAVRDEELYQEAARDRFVQESVKKQGPLAEFLNKYIQQWNEKPSDRGQLGKKTRGSVLGMVRDAMEQTFPPLSATSLFGEDMNDLPRIDPKAIAEQVGVLRYPQANTDAAGRAAAGRNVKGMLAAGAGLLGNGSMSGGAQATMALLDFLNGARASEDNWSPVTGAAAATGVNLLGMTGPMRRLLDLPGRDMRTVGGGNPLEILRSMVKGEGAERTAARLMWPMAQGAAADLGAQAGNPDTSMHTPYAGILMGLPGSIMGMGLSQHLHNNSYAGPTRTGQAMTQALEERTGLPIGRSVGGEFSVGLQPGDAGRMASTVEDVAERNVARETIQDALEPNKVRAVFQPKPEEVRAAFGKTLQRNLEWIYNDNPEFRTVVDAQTQRRMQSGMSAEAARRESLADVGKTIFQDLQLSDQQAKLPGYLRDAGTAAIQETREALLAKHSQAVGAAKESNRKYVDLLKESRLNAPETADVFKELTGSSNRTAYVKFNPQTGEVTPVKKGTPGAYQIENFEESARRIKPGQVHGQIAAREGQVGSNTLDDQMFFRKLQDPNFKQYVVDAAKAAKLPDDIANFSKGQAKAWKTFQNISDPKAFGRKLFEDPDALKTFVSHFGDVKEVIEPARRQVAQEILDGTANFIGPKAGSGNRVTGTAFERMAKMDPEDFDKLMGQKGAHKGLLELAEASKMAQEAIAESHITVQAKDIVMLTLATMYSMGASAGSQPLAFGLAAAAKTIGNFHFRRAQMAELLLNDRLPVIGKVLKKYWQNPSAVTGRQAQMFTKFISDALSTKPRDYPGQQIVEGGGYAPSDEPTEAPQVPARPGQ